eukprot:gene186-5185_t
MCAAGRTPLLVLFSAAAAASPTASYNGLAMQPPMTWRNWNAYGGDITQDKMERAMDKMVERSRKADGKATSLLDIGYVSAGLDDNWQACGTGVKNSFHDADGNPLVNTSRFPDLGAMVSYGHKLGLKVGWYWPNCICAEFMFGSDAAMTDKIYRGNVRAFRKYGFDGVKIDSCSTFNNMTRWAGLLEASGGPVLTEDCHDSDAQSPCPEAFACPASATCPYNMWRVSGDIGASWNSITDNLRLTLQWSGDSEFGDGPMSVPGRWAYPDMLQVGNLATQEEDRSHFGLWCVVSSPLVLSFDLMDDDKMDRLWDVITNREAIAVNQAWHGHPGTRVRTWTAGGVPLELWAKPQAGGAVAALVVSQADPGGAAAAVTVDFAWLKLSGAVTVRDIWAREDKGTHTTSFTTAALGGHDS